MSVVRQPRSVRTPPRLAYRLLWIGLLMWGCSGPPPGQEPTSDDRIGSVEAFVFKPDAQLYLTAPRPFVLDPDMAVEDALAALAGHLSRTYFNREPGSDPRIRFEIVKIHRLALPHRTYRLAVINMADPQLEALQVYFQGSAGGQTTFFMVTATLLQPQLAPPLLDGLILLYNGEPFPECDHVNFRGIVTPQAARSVVTKALFRSWQEDPATTG